MKLLVAIACLLFSTPVFAGGMPRYWNCMQIGLQGKKPVVVVSEVSNRPYGSYKAREEAFAKYVQQQYKLAGTYSPICQDFITQKEAKEALKNILEKANDHKLVVLPLNFKYGGKDAKAEAR